MPLWSKKLYSFPLLRKTQSLYARSKTEWKIAEKFKFSFIDGASILGSFELQYSRVYERLCSLGLLMQIQGTYNDLQ